MFILLNMKQFLTSHWDSSRSQRWQIQSKNSSNARRITQDKHTCASFHCSCSLPGRLVRKGHRKLWLDGERTRRQSAKRSLPQESKIWCPTQEHVTSAELLRLQCCVKRRKSHQQFPVPVYLESEYGKQCATRNPALQPPPEEHKTRWSALLSCLSICKHSGWGFVASSE